ncbi:MAG: ROK family protein [Ignavibacteria bacterium]|nr:ROK family protein [Ignavibacteria bacterium]MBI3765979.1 ROK family protein [Ignavibacteriales bacterium]
MTGKKTFAIGIDLGATTIKSGVVDKKGKIIDQLTVETRANKGPSTVIQHIVFSVRELFSKHKQASCCGIGIGAPGVVRIEDGSVHHPPNFSGWTEVALAKAIRNAFSVPVFIENDANCAALAEAKYGAGYEFKDFLFVVWGTGIGGGIILDRKIYRGPHGGAGEIGHLSIDYNGRECNCGSRGCIEAYIGQRYLSQRTKEILEGRRKDQEPSKIIELVDGNLEKIEPSIIAEAAELDDPVATEILEEAGDLLGSALASVMNILDLRVAVIGGGISAAPHFVFKSVEKSLRARVLKPHKNGIRIVRAKLGNSAGIIGAASLVF